MGCIFASESRNAEPGLYRISVIGLVLFCFVVVSSCAPVPQGHRNDVYFSFTSSTTPRAPSGAAVADHESDGGTGRVTLEEFMRAYKMLAYVVELGSK